MEFYRNVVTERQLKSQLSEDGLAKDHKSKLTAFRVVGPPGVIEDASGTLQADFANMWIGGAVLGKGCVQEEILFLEKPECLCAILFCQVRVGTPIKLNFKC